MRQKDRKDKNKKNQIATIVVILLIASGVFYFAYKELGLSVGGEIAPEIQKTSQEEMVIEDPVVDEPILDDPIFVEEEIPEKDKVDRVKISMVGDNLLHLPVVKSGLQTDGSYNFDHFFVNIEKYLSDSDIKIINQETVLGGVDLGLSGYPQFNSPFEVADAIDKAGFNIVTHANNHAMDKGYEGIKRTIENWDRFSDVLLLGVNRDVDDYNTVDIIEIDNIKIAFLSYTFSLNGIDLPTDKPWLVDTMYKEKIRKDLEKARETSDFIVVIPHWGDEYQYTPNSYQIDMTNLFSSNGADLIIGSHPHVLQSVEWIERSDGKKTLVYYSLGNYISNQNRPPRMLGGMANISIEKDSSGETKIVQADIIPLVTHYEWGVWDTTYTTYALEDYTDELAAKHGVKREEFDKDGNKIVKENFSLPWLKQLCSEILGEDWYQQ